MASIRRSESFPAQFFSNCNRYFKRLTVRSSRSVIILASLALLLIGVLRFGNLLPAMRAAATVQNSVSVTSVSAASFVPSPAPLGQNSIAAAFGTELAPGLQVAMTQPLPTTLGGTTVTVGGIAAQLFFASPGQVNYLVPSNVAPGDAEVVVTANATNGDQIVSRGQVKIAASAPAIFTANSNGVGVPAAVTGRVNANNQFVFDPNPPFEPDPVTPGRLIASPIDVGTATQPAFLILYATGLRNAAAGSVSAIIGGIEVPVEPVAAPGFTGLDQVNLQIPLSLKGRGPVDVSIVAAGVSSNSVAVNLAGTSSATLAVTSFSVTEAAIAGQTISINGSGFSTNAADNVVRFGSAQARVIAATANQLTVIVPFGAESGRVLIQNQLGETRSAASFRVKTSLSGIVQSTGSTTSEPVPLEGVAVRVVGTNISVRTNLQGAFVVADVPPGPAQVEVDGATTNVSPPFPRITLKKTVLADRDNQIVQPVSLQQANGGSGTVGSFDKQPGVGSQFSAAFRQMVSVVDSFAKSPTTNHQPPATKEQATNKNTVISDQGVSLEVPIGTTVKFPDGKTRGSVQVTVVNRSRLPGLSLPVGVYSSAIAQITPLGAQFSPGASLTFPNPDSANLAPGAKVDLYRYDFQAGVFIKRGTATVSADRSQVVSDSRVVDLASFWFAAAPAGVTTVVGRVINEFGLGVAGAHVTVRGRAGTTDSNGGFSVIDVATAGNAQIQAEAVLPRQWASAPRGKSSLTTAVVGGVTNVGTIALANTNVTGLVLSPFVIDFDSADPPKKVDVTLTQPAATGGLVVSLTSQNTNVATVPASVTIPAGQTTTSFNVARTGPGVAIIQAKATVAGNALETFAVVTVSLPAPVLAAVNPTSAAPGAKIVVSGTGLSSVPDNNIFGLLRGDNLIWIFNPDDNEILTDATGKVSVRLEVPPVGAGAVTIRGAVINTSTGVLSDISGPLNFTVNASNVPVPVLGGVSPGQGKPRDRVTITGSNFSTTLLQNIVIFRQEGVESLARVVQASATQLVVAVPSRDLVRGRASIIASRIGSDGARSSRSNALEFTLTEDASAPPKPTLASVVNAVTGQASGRDGNTIRAQGTNFGLNFLNVLQADLGNDEPLISLLLYYQNGKYVNFTLPTGAQGGTQLTSVVPTGLAAGQAQITVVNFDLENGLLSDESSPVNFSVTVSSLRHINEDEPNDSLETATELTIPIIVDGTVRFSDPADLIIPFNDGTAEKLHDLFFLDLANDTALTITLGFLPTGDLDLFILQEDADGNFVVVASSVRNQTIIEQLSGTLKAGQYIIAVGAFAGSSGYLLTVTQGASLNETGAPVSLGVRHPALVERKKN
ncbi:MAG: IPT/TIG domain-containing protein [Acidobacteria bacterium]|nr:IPT/TIG domain-containing protein [Acidobacteriota bacterium]